MWSASPLRRRRPEPRANRLRHRLRARDAPACSATPKPGASRPWAGWACSSTRAAPAFELWTGIKPDAAMFYGAARERWRRRRTQGRRTQAAPEAGADRDMTLPLTRNIYFTGFMASGKSRIGSLTAASLGWKFFDIDKLIEEKTGKAIPAIFAEDGEAAFRAHGGGGPARNQRPGPHGRLPGRRDPAQSRGHRHHPRQRRPGRAAGRPRR